MTRLCFETMMGKYLDLEKDDLKEIVDLIGQRTSLSEGLNLAKALINNYFEEDDSAKKIIKLIEEEQKL